MIYLVKEIILGEEFKNRFVQKTEYDDNMNKAYALLLGQYRKELMKTLQARKYREADIKN